jgi:hypothetical protein
MNDNDHNDIILDKMIGGDSNHLSIPIVPSYYTIYSINKTIYKDLINNY